MSGKYYSFPFSPEQKKKKEIKKNALKIYIFYRYTQNNLPTHLKAQIKL